MDIKTSLLRSFGDLRDIKKNLFLSNFIGLYLFQHDYTKRDTAGMMVESNIHSNKCPLYVTKIHLCNYQSKQYGRKRSIRHIQLFSI